MELPYLAAAFLKTLVDVMSKPVLRIGTKDGLPFADIVFDDDRRQTIDERIEKIDAARANLADALGAIDDLKAAANANEADLEIALAQLGKTQAEHSAARKELELVRQAVSSDVDIPATCGGSIKDRDCQRAGSGLCLWRSSLTDRIWNLVGRYLALGESGRSWMMSNPPAPHVVR